MCCNAHEKEMESGVGLLGNATVVPDASPTEGISQFSPRIVAQSRSSSRRVQARRRTFVIVCVACFLSPALFFSKLRWGSGEGSWRIGRKRSKDHEAEAVSSTRRACVPPAQKCREGGSWRGMDGIFQKLQGGKDGRRSKKRRREQTLGEQDRDISTQSPQEKIMVNVEQLLNLLKSTKDKLRREGKLPKNPFSESKRRALQDAWRRVRRGVVSNKILKAVIDKIPKKKGKGGDETETRMELVAELRGRIDRYPGDLMRRAKAVRHDLDDGMLLRYLEMAYWTMETAGQPLDDAIESTLRWREEMKPHLITKRDVLEEAKEGKMYVRGFDRQDRPIMYYTPGLGTTFDANKGLELLFFNLERAKAMMPRGQTKMAVITDCAGFSPAKTPPLTMLKTAIVAMQQHYPMYLGYIMIVNASGPVLLLWKLITPLLHDRTKEKIVFLTKKEAAATFAEHIDPSVLPSTLPGGRDPFRYGREAHLSS